MLVVSLLATVACSCGGADATRESGAGPQSESTADSACEEHDEAVDECAGILGLEEAPERVLQAVEDLGAVSANAFTVLRSEAELQPFWTDSGLTAAGIAPPEVDFSTQQLVAFSHDAVSCHSNLAVGGFYALAADAGELVARIDTDLQCETCDTGARWVLDVWVTRAAPLSVCRLGTECVGCP
jgi:hypothetical protein